MTKTKSKIKFPATMTVHWPSGPVNTCDEHGQALAGLGRMLGSHIALTKLLKPAQCTNCVNEAAPHL